MKIFIHDPAKDLEVIQVMQIDEEHCHPSFIGKIVLDAVAKDYKINIKNTKKEG